MGYAPYPFVDDVIVSTVVLTTLPEIYTKIYHETPGYVGLHYISLGLG